MRQEMLYARNTPAVDGAQWTGIVTQIAINMLESGAVDAVVCVQSTKDDRFAPKPVCVPLFVVCAFACSVLWFLASGAMVFWDCWTRQGCLQAKFLQRSCSTAKYYSSLDLF